MLIPSLATDEENVETSSLHEECCEKALQPACNSSEMLQSLKNKITIKISYDRVLDRVRLFHRGKREFRKSDFTLLVQHQQTLACLHSFINITDFDEEGLSPLALHE